MQTLPSFLITQCVTDLVEIRSQPCQVPGARCRWPVAKPRWRLSRGILSSLLIHQLLQSKFPERNFVGVFAQCWIIWGPAAPWWVVSIKFGHGIACAGGEEVSGASHERWPAGGQGRGRAAVRGDHCNQSNGRAKTMHSMVPVCRSDCCWLLGAFATWSFQQVN